MKIINKIKKIIYLLKSDLNRVILIVYYLVRHPWKFWHALSEKSKKWALRGLVFLLVVLIAVPTSIWLGSKKTEAAWWNDSWGYRKSVNITNNTTEQTNVYVSLTLDTSTAGRFQADCGDLRFTKTNGDVLPYYIYSGCGTASTVVYVNFDVFPAGAQTLYYYYGNPTAGDGFTALSGSGAVTQANMKISAVDGTAFTDFSTSGTLTPYLGSKLVVTDSASKKLTGYIKAAGTGETYDSELVTNGTFDTGNFTGWTEIGDATATEDATANKGLSTLTSSGAKWYYQPFALGQSKLYKLYADIADKNNAESIGFSVSDGVSYYSPASSKRTTNGAINIYYNITSATMGAFQMGSTGALANGTVFSFDNVSIRQVTAPSATGATITSTSNGGTFNWTSQEASFNYNDASNYTYKIYPLAFSTEASNYTVGTIGAEEKGTGPVVYWAFDEGQGITAQDSTANNNDGTLTNMSATSSPTSGWQTEDNCVAGKCLAFDGGDDYVVFPKINALEGSADYTMAAWIKTTVAQTGGVIGQFDSGSHITSISISAGGVAEFVTYEGGYSTVSSNTTISNGQWRYIVIVKSGATGRIYIDGVEKNSGTVRDVTATTEIRVGTRENNAYPFNGKIDEPKIYNYARTAAQIKLDYNAGLAGTGGQSGAAVSMGKKSQKWLTDGLVGHWKMDETSWSGVAGEVKDASGNSNNGTAAGGATTAAGKFGNGGSFDGTDDYVSGTADAFNISGDKTVCSWFKTSNSANYNFIFKNNLSDILGYELFLNNTGTLSFSNRGDYTDGASGVTNLTNGNWHFGCGVINGASIHIYADGKIDGSGIVRGVATASADFLIGERSSGLNFFGNLDDVRVYNRALSDREVRDLYAYAPGPVAYYNFEEGSGGSVNDTSGNSNTGAWAGSETGSRWVAGKFGKAGNFNSSRSDYVEMGGSGTLNITGSAVTEGAWIRTSASGSVNNISGNSGAGQNGYNFAIDNGGLKVEGRTDVTNFIQTVGSGMADGNWHYVAFTYDGSKIRFYKDGVDLGSPISITGKILTAGVPFRVGCAPWSTGDFRFNGQIDEVRVYNYARTSDQIIEDMQARGTSAEGGEGSASVSASGKTTVGYWKFDEGYGDTANDSSPQNNDGDLAGACPGAATCPTWSNDGKFGKALSFDGSNDYVALATNPIHNSNTFTISAWIYKTSAATGDILSNRYPGADAKVDGISLSYTSGEPAYTINAHSIVICVGRSGSANNNCWTTPAESIAQNTWYYVASVWQTGSNPVVYINGVSQTMTAWTGVVNDNPTTLNWGNSNDPFWIGRGSHSYNDNPWQGLIDEPKIYNYALTADEVKVDYNKGSSIKLGSYSQSSTGAGLSSSASLYCVPGSTDTCSAPVGEWKFEEGSGQSAQDTSGNGNTGTLGSGGTPDSADPIYSPGKNGKALKFDGVDDYVEVIDNNSLDFGTSDFTIGFWAKPDAASLIDRYVYGSRNIGDANENIEVFAYATGGGQPPTRWNLRASSGGSEVLDILSTANSLILGSWQYVEIVCDRDSAANSKIYINGVDKTSGTPTVSALSISTTGSKIIGARGTKGQGFYGPIDEFRIYNYARTPAQIALDYNQGDPVGRWRMDECQGGTINDSSGNKNHGTWYGTGGGTQTSVGTCTTAGTAWGNGATGKRNASLNFDGTDDNVNLGSPSSGIFNFDATQNFSISAWIKTTSFSYPERVIVGKTWNLTNEAPNLGYTLMMDHNGHPNMYLRNGSNVVGSAISDKTYWDSQWHLITASIDRVNGNIKMYADGVLKTTTDISSFTYSLASSFELHIGDHQEGNRFWPGQIDDVQIFNYALTPVQIKTLYSGGAVNFR